MNKIEEVKVRKAIELLMSDEGFNDGIDILCSLVGLERSVSKALSDPTGKTVSIFGLFAGGETVEHSVQRIGGTCAICGEPAEVHHVEDGGHEFHSANH